LARDINSAAVSLGVCSHSAQIRAVGRGFERAEQEIQSARAVGADIGQFCRSLGEPLLLLPEVRRLRLRGKRQRRHQQAGQSADERWESHDHPRSLNAEKRAAKQRGVKGA
jgi:hypothetical protein